jgi:hypothetical protein
VALLADERRNVILERHAEAQRLDVDLGYVSDMDLSDLIRKALGATGRGFEASEPRSCVRVLTDPRTASLE